MPINDTYVRYDDFAGVMKSDKWHDHVKKVKGFIAYVVAVVESNPINKQKVEEIRKRKEEERKLAEEEESSE